MHSRSVLLGSLFNNFKSFITVYITLDTVEKKITKITLNLDINWNYCCTFVKQLAH